MGDQSNKSIVMRRGEAQAYHNDIGLLRNQLIREYLQLLHRHVNNKSTEEDKKTKLYGVLQEMAETKPGEYVRLFSSMIKQDALLTGEYVKEKQQKEERTVKFVG